MTIFKGDVEKKLAKCQRTHIISSYPLKIISNKFGGVCLKAIKKPIILVINEAFFIYLNLLLKFRHKICT